MGSLLPDSASHASEVSQKQRAKVMGFGIYNIYRMVQPRFRRKRLRLFLDVFKPDERTKILDVGGTVYDWAGLEPLAAQVTVVNVAQADLPPKSHPCLGYVVGDGRQLPFPDNSFDVVYSNSVIEHLGSWANQIRFAAEIMRVGRGVFVETPNRWFPIEPHFITAFFHYLPKRIQRLFLPHFSLRGIFRSGDNVGLQQLFAELRLLSYREMHQLFPTCEIHRERFIGFTKSLIAIRHR